MKKPLIFTALLLFSLSFVCRAQEVMRMNVMSFNIRYDNPEDGKQNWHHRKENGVKTTYKRCKF